MEEYAKANSTSQKPIITKVALLLILVLAFIFFTKRDWILPQKVQVPQELILGEEIDSSKVRLEFPDPEKVDFVQYRTNRELPDVVDFYLHTFSVDGWSVIQSIETTGSVRISATNQKENLNASIGIFDTNKGPAPILVAITFRKK